jgi:hypothetical protein
MGAACAAFCGVAVIVAGCIVAGDDWVDRDARLIAVFGILLGVGAVLHALGVW